MKLISILFLMILNRCLPMRSILQSTKRRSWVSSLRMSSTSSTQSSKVCIVGGGFGGLYTALKLSKESINSNTEIYLFDNKDKFVFLPLLYELAVGTASVVEVAPRYSDLLKGTSIKFIQGKVKEIKDTKLSVVTAGNDDASPTEFNFDKLVLATGSQPRADVVSGALTNALPFSRVEDAYRLKARLRVLATSDLPLIRVVVIGGGYSGVEVATSVAEYLGRDRGIVSIVDRNECIMHSAPTHNIRIAEKSLLSYGVSLNLNSSVKEVTSDGVIIEEPSKPPFKLPADLVILTCGIQPSELVSNLNFSKDKTGRIRTWRTLQTVDNPNVFALGDCAVVDGERIPATAQAAMQQASIVSRNIALLQKNNATDRQSSAFLEKFRFVPLGEMLTLGGSINDASVSSLGGLIELQGPLAAIARRAVYAARMPTVTQAITAGVSAGLVTVAGLLFKSLPQQSKK